jgi:hypothetical protein
MLAFLSKTADSDTRRVGSFRLHRLAFIHLREVA